mmetsp:Transcript_15878/g.47174  ORF Transcript_15878/g.47174 Transcript_15878/m.47174 type:complete len:351 (+) Transcript_15878:646-1698(+)
MPSLSTATCKEEMQQPICVVYSLSLDTWANGLQHLALSGGTSNSTTDALPSAKSDGSMATLIGSGVGWDQSTKFGLAINSSLPPAATASAEAGAPPGCASATRTKEGNPGRKTSLPSSRDKSGFRVLPRYATGNLAVEFCTSPVAASSIDASTTKADPANKLAPGTATRKGTAAPDSSTFWATASVENAGASPTSPLRRTSQGESSRSTDTVALPETPSPNVYFAWTRPLTRKGSSALPEEAITCVWSSASSTSKRGSTYSSTENSTEWVAAAPALPTAVALARCVPSRGSAAIGKSKLATPCSSVSPSSFNNLSPSGLSTSKRRARPGSGAKLDGRRASTRKRATWPGL